MAARYGEHSPFLHTAPSIYALQLLDTTPPANQERTAEEAAEATVIETPLWQDT